MSNENDPYQRAGLLKMLCIGVALIASAAWAEPAPLILLSAPLAGSDLKMHRIDDWHGKLRVVNFWAPWCLPCRAEIPHLISARKEWHRQGLEVIGIAIDSDEQVREFEKQVGIDYPILLADGKGDSLMRTAGNHITALPFTLLLDGEGRILQRHTGPLDAALLRQWLQDATKNKS